MDDLKKHFIYPSGLIVKKEPYIFSTILGSCVSVCLWDSEKKFGGLNHYMLPLWNGNGLASPKYGNISIEMLIDKTLKFGSLKKNLIAKVFGGANMINSNSGLFNIGNRNVELAFEMLGEANVPVIAYSTGGIIGRKLFFNNQTGEIRMKFLSSKKK